MIVDCHAHLLPPRRMMKLVEWTLRFNPRHPIALEVSLEALLAEYATAGVDAVWNFAHAIFPDETDALNEWNARLGAEHPQIIPFGTCHPQAPDPVAVIDRCFTHHRFRGMKFHPFVQRFTPWEPRFFPVWERIAFHRGIVVFHTGLERFYGGALPLAGFEPIVRDFPEMTVVLAHANFPGVAEAFEMVARYPNVYVDTVHVFTPFGALWQQDSRPAVWDELRRGLEAFPDRAMFGTDHPSGTGTLAQMYGHVRAFELEPDLEAKLLGGIAARLVGSEQANRRATPPP